MAASMDINAVVAVLQAARSKDLSVRQPAEKQLHTLAEGNAPMFFIGMATVLAKEEVPADLRQLAGLLMKTALDARNDVLRDARATRWLAIDTAVRTQIKNMAVQTLASPDAVAAHTAAVVVACIGGIELRTRQWPELIAGLLSKINKPHLECLGYLCEELPPEYVDQTQTNSILFAIMTGMRPDQSDEVRKTACTALLNTLDFAKRNMNVPAECKLIMESVISATECTHKDVRLVAFQCLVRVAELYYGVLQPWVPKCYERTFAGITTMEEEVSRQALEFWHTLAEEERDLYEQEADAAANGQTVEVKANGYCRLALSNLVKLLTEQMCHQSADMHEDDVWNMAMASGTCLGALAQTCPDIILNEVMPFVKANIASDDWHKREAATLAFGSCMEGPPAEQLMVYIRDSLPFLLSKLTPATADPEVAVRDTTAWTIGKILADHFARLDHSTLTAPLVNTLSVAMLGDEPRVAANCCFGIYNMADALSQWPDPSTNLLSPHFQGLVQKLLQCTVRDGWDECSLRNTAYEALNAVVQNSADDVQELLMKLVPVLLAKLQTSVETPITSADDKEEQYGLQVNLCGLLQTIMIRVEGRILPHANTIFTLLMRVFGTTFATAHAEAYMAMGSLASAIEGKFADYMHAFFPQLCKGLNSVNEYGVCYVAVGVISDLCRALEAGMQPYADQLVGGLVKHLSNKMLHRSVKPGMLSAFGDIALAVGVNFPRARVQEAMRMLMDASGTTVSEDDEDLVEFLMDLRVHILDGLTAFVQGFNVAHSPLLSELHPHVPRIAQFLRVVAEDPNRDAHLVLNATALIGDLCQAMPGPAAAAINKTMPWVQSLLRECRESGDDEAVEMATWTAGLLV